METRGTWKVYKFASGDVWVENFDMYRPNENLEIGKISTQRKAQLADGSHTFITYSTKSNKQPLRFTWLGIDKTDSLISTIEGYVDNGDYLKIVDHNNETYIGKFIDIQRIWLTGIDPDTCDIQATFEQEE